MKDDYLWDGSGEPDPEIQQLEEILGGLRYQPRPLEIPAELQTGSKRFYVPRYAIAAALAFLVLGLGVWLATQRQGPSKVVAGKSEESKPANISPIREANAEAPQRAAAGPIDEKKLSTLSAKNNTGNKSRPRRIVRTPRMTPEEIAEAEIAKDRLMLALRLASSKLNYAQKKTQGSASPVYHQHKIG